MFAEQAGYDAVLIMQNDVGAAPRCEATNLNMTTDNLPVPVSIKMLLIPRNVGFRMLGLYNEATYQCDPASPAGNTPNPPVNTAGLPVTLAFEFDGWGYTHIYKNGAGKLKQSTGTPSPRRTTSASRAASATSRSTSSPPIRR